MAIGKNKKGGKGGKKKQKYDSFFKKEWYKIRSPRTFTNRDMGWTCVNKSSGNRIATDYLKGRHFEFYLGDLKRENNSDENYKKQAETDGQAQYGFRKIDLVCEEVKNNDCLTNFAGMTLTTEKLRDSIKKWHSLVEAHEDVRTTDGYLLRLFCMARTKQGHVNQIKKTCYAKSSQIREIRKKMVDTMRNEVISCNLEEVVNKLIPNNIGHAIQRTCQFTFPIDDVYIRKVKVLRRPPLDYTKIMSLHEGVADEPVDVAELPPDAVEAEEYIP